MHTYFFLLKCLVTNANILTVVNQVQNFPIYIFIVFLRMKDVRTGSLIQVRWLFHTIIFIRIIIKNFVLLLIFFYDLLSIGNVHLFSLDKNKLHTRYICQEHFSPESFLNNNKSRLINNTAVPYKYYTNEQPSTSSTGKTMFYTLTDQIYPRIMFFSIKLNIN